MRNRNGIILAFVTAAALLAVACAPPPAPAPPPPPPPPPTVGGYATFAATPQERFVLRIHPSAAHMRGDIHFAAAETARLAGIRIDHGPDTGTTHPDLNASEIVVYSANNCGSASAAGCAHLFWDGSANIMMGAGLVVVPAWAHRGERRQVLLHEFGHAMGLDHFPHNFANVGPQMMHPVVQTSLGNFSAGDANGLRDQGSAGRARAAARSPFGNIDGVTGMVQGAVVVNGWAADPDWGAAPIEVTARVTGGASQRVTAQAWRPDVAKAYPQYGGSRGFSIIVPATAGTRQVCVTAHNKRWGTDQALGCRNVTVPAAPPQETPPPAPEVDPAMSAASADTTTPPPPLALGHSVHDVFVDVVCDPETLTLRTPPASLFGSALLPSPVAPQQSPSHSHSCGCGCATTPRRELFAAFSRQR